MNHNRKRDHTDELSSRCPRDGCQSIAPRHWGQWHFGGTWGNATRRSKQIAAKNTLVINQLKLICGTPKKEKPEENEREREEAKRSRQKLTERSANYEWIFSQLHRDCTPFYQAPPPHFLSHNFYNESQCSTGNYLASDGASSVWFMQRCATVFLPLGLV